MLHSQYLAEAKLAVRHVIDNVRYRGLNTAGGWIRHPLEAQQKTTARITNKVMGAIADSKHSGPFDPVKYIDTLEAIALASQTGNCSELSAVAFNFLKRRGVRSIDYFGVFRGSWNHAFVVLNRNPDITVSDFAAWSYDAVVCDPLYDRAADAGHLAVWYKNMFPLRERDVWYSI